jgi:thioesterase domain-containing protein
MLIENKTMTRSLGEHASAYARQNHTIERYVDYYLEIIKQVAPK